MTFRMRSALAAAPQQQIGTWQYRVRLRFCVFPVGELGQVGRIKF